MVPERLLLGGAAAVVLVAIVAVAAVPGTLSPGEPEPVRPVHLQVAELSIAPGSVSGETATLSVETRLRHGGGPAENVTLLLRAVGLESGLVETTREIEVEPVRGEREIAVPANLTVARDGGYRIEAIVFNDGARLDTAAKSVRGVGSLTPEYARTDVRFHDFGRTGQPVIEYEIDEVADDRATLQVRTYLTNEGDGSPGPLRLTVTARQADSNIITDRAEVSVGDIPPGRTATPEVSLVVPDGYNYFLDAVLWKDGVIVGTARSVANLDPTETLAANVTTREVGLEISDFEDRRGEAPPPEPQEPDTDTGGQPGFTAGLAVAALLGTLLVARRRST